MPPQSQIRFARRWASPHWPRRALAAGALVVALAAACASREPAHVVRLEISSLNTYAVNGEPVERGALTTALLLRKRTGEELLVHVLPAQGAKYEAVQAAVEAAQKAGARLGMVGNVAFSPSPQSSGSQR